jgi:hypothetical protein
MLVCATMAVVVGRSVMSGWAAAAVFWEVGHLIAPESSMTNLQDKCKTRKIHHKIPMDHERSLQHLKEALQTHHKALEQLDSALLEFEQSISGEATQRPQQDEQRGSVQLLSIPQLCQELGMGKSSL